MLVLAAVAMANKHHHGGYGGYGYDDYYLPRYGGGYGGYGYGRGGGYGYGHGGGYGGYGYNDYK